MKFIQLRSYDDYISAHIILGRLKDEYINCYLENEHTITTGPFLSNALGGIRLMVVDTQAERAKELLEQFDRGE